MVHIGVITGLDEPLDSNGDYALARVEPHGLALTRPMTIPRHLRGERGRLEIGVNVVCVIPPGDTGLILSRLDGEVF